jgi:hypothetical protein
MLETTAPDLWTVPIPLAKNSNTVFYCDTVLLENGTVADRHESHLNQSRRESKPLKPPPLHSSMLCQYGMNTYRFVRKQSSPLTAHTIGTVSK